MIQNIHIKTYKCFNNFQTTPFKRINLIGGLNNVGKTAFIEACYLVSTADKLSNFLFALAAIERSRDKLNFSLLEDINIIEILKNNHSIEIDSLNIIQYKFHEDDLQSSVEINLNNTLYNIDFKSSLHFKKKTNTIFIDHFGFTNSELKDVYTAAQFKDKDIEINKFLENFNFKNPKFKIIDNTPYLKTDNTHEYNKLNTYGDGIKHYIAIIASLYACENGYLFIDEIENGMHYTLFDKLWEIIFKIAQEQNVQLFITTHSQECISAFNKISMLYDDSLYFELGKNRKTQQIFIRELDNTQLNYELTHNGRYRGE